MRASSLKRNTAATRCIMARWGGIAEASAVKEPSIKHTNRLKCAREWKPGGSAASLYYWIARCRSLDTPIPKSKQRPIPKWWQGPQVLLLADRCLKASLLATPCLGTSMSHKVFRSEGDGQRKYRQAQAMQPVVSRLFFVLNIHSLHVQDLVLSCRTKAEHTWRSSGLVVPPFGIFVCLIVSYSNTQ